MVGARKSKRNKGSLTVVGSGIEAITHITLQTRACIERSDKVLYALGDDVTEEWICRLNRSAESIDHLYDLGKPRKETYAEVVEGILRFVRKGLNVCVVFYGHPGVYCVPGHTSIRRAREEGFSARMLPAVSSMDCLFADVGIDPGARGFQSFLATDFLEHPRKFAPTTPLCLLQIGMIGESGQPIQPCNREGLKALAGALMKHYSPEHRVLIYEASQFVVSRPEMRNVRLAALPKARVMPISTLYVPPIGRSRGRGTMRDTMT